MSDPTIQTFCCHHGNGTDVAITVMQDFDTATYNIICIWSAALGILGAIYQILPREEFTNSHRWISISAQRGRNIVVWLAVADLFAAIGVFGRSVVWLKYQNIMPAVNDHSSVLFCAISSAFIQYFYTSSWIWTLCYAIDMRFILSQKESYLLFYHVTAWILPAILTVSGLLLLYFPDANCHTSTSLQTALYRILPNYIATYVPIAIVMIANPILYQKSIGDMKKIITSASGQFTSRERDILEVVQMKFFVINVVFYVCWLPNLVNGVMLWTQWFNLPEEYIIAVWYMIAFANPLQACFNTLVYRRWNLGSERVILPWRQRENANLQLTASLSTEGTAVSQEILPLLRNAPSNSINGYHSLP